jgi:hypothetical protein
LNATLAPVRKVRGFFLGGVIGELLQCFPQSDDLARHVVDTEQVGLATTIVVLCPMLQLLTVETNPCSHLSSPVSEKYFSEGVAQV